MASIEPVRAGYKRQWVECKTCGNVAYYDYLPYSLSNPVQSLPCGHDVGGRFHDAVKSISADEALIAIAANL